MIRPPSLVGRNATYLWAEVIPAVIVNLAIITALSKQSAYYFCQENMVEDVKPDSSIEEEFKLFNLTDVDRATLRQTDEQFVPHDWEELKTIVGKAPNLPSP